MEDRQDKQGQGQSSRSDRFGGAREEETRQPERQIKRAKRERVERGRARVTCI